MGALTNAGVDYSYSRPNELGTGLIRVSTTLPLQVTASASPTSIAPGGSSNLSAFASGGTPPYSYLWNPANGLSDISSPTPSASPPFSTLYTVAVTDALGAVASANVLLNVTGALTVTANPATIDPGQSSQLNVQVTGGAPPYNYSWSPAGTLSDTGLFNPVASPATSTTYDVTVLDANGNLFSGSVNVRVNMQLTVRATPNTVVAGTPSQLDVAVTGGRPPYNYIWNPAASLDDSRIASPLASPSVTTTYAVIVGDADGQVVTEFMTVNVMGGGLTACFNLNPDPPAAFQPITFDGSCSNGGNIVWYRWWFNWSGNPAQPADFISPAPVVQAGFESPGPTNVRLEVEDNLGNIAELIQSYSVQ